MLKRITNLKTIYDGDLVIDEVTKNKVTEIWNDFIKDKNPGDFFDGDIYCVTHIDDTIPLINVSKTKYSNMIYGIKTNNIIIRSLFSASYIRTSDNYICIILNNRDVLNTIGGMADNSDMIDGEFDYRKCLIREFKEELGIDLLSDSNFDINLKYLKYPSGEDLEKAYFPVGTLFEINSKYTKNEIIKLFYNNVHENEIKELKFYNSSNYEEVYKYDKKQDYIDELFKTIFE